MEHDPFCTCSVGDCPFCPVGCVCDCQFIAKVRADEREQAAQRLEAPDLHHEWCDLGTVSEGIKGTPNTGICDCYHAKCIAAARGET